MGSLLKILAKDLNEWPHDAYYIGQAHDGDIHVNDACNEFIRHTGQFLTIADDWNTAEITQAQWQAERDRQKGGEWKRHRGGRNQPVNAGVRVEVKLRCGDIQQGNAHEFIWLHSECDVAANIMQYRVISQPQAEEVEMKLNQRAQDELSKPDSEKGIIQHESSAAFFEHLGIAKTDQIDGPLAWRDTIIHCQAIIEDCEREIQRNVDLLDAEGLMMQTDSKKAMQHYAPAIDMSDWRNWKAGDLLKVVDSVEDTHDIDEGEIVIFDGQDINRRMDAARCTYNSDIRYYWILRENVEFHSRP